MNTQKLLTRDEFRKACLKRDGYRCVVCGNDSKIPDVHHIIERRLFDDGGYYLNNGASLCNSCHIKAEETTLSVEDIRKAAQINEKVLPEHLYSDQEIDKWGNPILSNGTRTRGELFDDPSVQKILDRGNVLSLFTKYVKYPRTWHLPWSPGITKSDRVLKDCSQFEGKEVIITVKMDGENTTLYNDYIHARSINDKKHWSKSWIKNFHSRIAPDMSDDMRFCVENVYAKHSIHYQNLESYCYGFSMWNGLWCVSWDTTLEWFALLDIPVVPQLYRGIWNEELVRNLYQPSHNGDECEGYVVRLVDTFHYRNFSKSAAKFVRANHVTENEHWFHGKAGEINKLKELNV